MLEHICYQVAKHDKGDGDESIAIQSIFKSSTNVISNNIKYKLFNIAIINYLKME